MEKHLSLQSIKLNPLEEWLTKHDGIYFIFITEGAGKFVSKTTSLRFGAGDVLVLHGNLGVKLCALEKTTLMLRNFSLVLEQLFPLFGSHEISLLQSVTANLSAVKTYPGNKALAQRCHQLLEQVPLQFNLEHRSQLLLVASAILSTEFEEAQNKRGGLTRIEDRIIQVFERLSAAELMNLTVGELSAKFNCSRRHLNRLFHQHFGLSVATLKMEMRLINAVNLLRNPDAKVINVAEQCGFNHLGLFNTCFKRRFGSSPGQWRKLNLKSEGLAVKKPDIKQVCPLRSNVLCTWRDPSEASNLQAAMHGMLSSSGNRSSGPQART